MNELVKIDNQVIGGEKIQAVDAKDLYDFLGVKSDFKNWIKNRINDLQLVENRDFMVWVKNYRNSKGGRPSKEYFVTLDTAKHLAMMERNEKGFQIREYFIQVEKEARLANSTMLENPIVKLAMEHAALEQEQRRQLQLLIDQQKQIDNIELRAKSIADNQLFTAKAYSIKLNRNYSRTTLAAIGRECKRISLDRGYDMGKALDEQFYKVNTYHESILQEVFGLWEREK